MTIQTPASCFCDIFLNTYGDHNAKIKKIYSSKTAFGMLVDQIRPDALKFFWPSHLLTCKYNYYKIAI